MHTLVLHTLVLHTFVLHSKAYLSALLITVIVLTAACDSALLREVTYHERLGNIEQARAAAERAAADPSNSEASFLLGRLLLQQGTYLEAHAAFERANAQTTRYSERIAFLLESAYREAMLRGADAYGEAQFAEAATNFKAAAAIDPASADAFRALGHASIRVDDRKGAIDAYKTAASLAPESYEIWNNLAELLTLEGDFEPAHAAALQASALSPDARPSLRRLAFLEEKLGQFDAAEARYETLIDGSHTHADERNYAFLLYNREKFDRALPHLELLAEHGQPDIAVLRILVETYLALEDFPKAIGVGLQLLEREPESRDVVSNLIVAYEKIGDTEQVSLWRNRLTRMEDEL